MDDSDLEKEIEAALDWIDNRYEPIFERLMVEKVWPEANDNFPDWKSLGFPLDNPIIISDD